MMWRWGFGPIFMFPGMLLGGLFLLLLVVALVVLIAGASSRPAQPGGASARTTERELMDIVRLRYARGEITREQFEQYQRDFQAAPGPTPPAAPTASA